MKHDELTAIGIIYALASVTEHKTGSFPAVKLYGAHNALVDAENVCNLTL